MGHSADRLCSAFGISREAQVSQSLYKFLDAQCAFQTKGSHYTSTHMGNKNSNIQGRSSNIVKVIYHTIRNCSYLGKNLLPEGVPILKRDTIGENHCLIQ